MNCLAARPTLLRLMGRLVVLVHFAWTLFIVLGLAAGARSNVWAAAHIAGLALMLVVFLGPWRCPLTDLENALRVSSDSGDGYDGSFVFGWLHKLVNLRLSDAAQRSLALAWAGLNGLGYWLVWRG